MKASQIFNFTGYVGATLLTGLISLSAVAEVSHPAKLSQKALAGAAFDAPSTTITEVEGEKILDFTSLKSSDGKHAVTVTRTGPEAKCVAHQPLKPSHTRQLTQLALTDATEENL